jgi:hypothetical protein
VPFVNPVTLKVIVKEVSVVQPVVLVLGQRR